MSNDIQPISPMEALNATQSLEVYDRISNPMEAIKVLGAAIFKSGMFGCDRQEQGEVLAMQCIAERKPPLEIQSTYHFIKGRLAIKSDALLGRFLKSGGTVSWDERSDKKVVATFEKNGSKVTVTQTIERWIANGVATGPNKGTWDKHPMAMLTARAITEGVRLVGADCCIGVPMPDDTESGRTLRPVPTSIIDIIPPGKVDTAVALLIKTGMLEEGQSLSDLSPNDEATILKKPAPFIAALNS